MDCNCKKKCKQTLCCSQCMQRKSCELVCRNCVPEKSEKNKETKKNK